MSDANTIWTNASFSAPAMDLLRLDLAPHKLIVCIKASASNLEHTGHDPKMADADIAFGQPEPQQVIDSPSIKWVHLTSAGYTRYDTDAFRSAMKARHGIFTNSSSVYFEPCAQHAMAMILSLSRHLPQALDDQRGDRRWLTEPLRVGAHLLRGQSILIYGYGAIARRLVEMLRPFQMKITGVRRKSTGDEGVPMVSAEQADQLLGSADHVMNILPQSPHTEHFFNARRFALLSPGAIFYNIGRGATVDQDALAAALRNRTFAGAFLDVTTPEPLPADHPLWQISNCWITPHTAGGHHDEALRLVTHFRENLNKFSRGEKLVDVVF